MIAKECQFKSTSSFTIYSCETVNALGTRVVNTRQTLFTSAIWTNAMNARHMPWRKSRELEFTFQNATAPGIDVAILIALGSAVADIFSLFQPWLLGINDEYLSGKGLSYAVEVRISGFQLMQSQQYLAILLVPALLAGLSLILAIMPEDVSARLGYKLKSGALLAISTALSLYPSYVFMNNLGNGVNMTEGLNVIVSFWEIGSGSTLPAYAAFGFAGALLIRIFKD
jgi:hypothetical protein